MTGPDQLEEAIFNAARQFAEPDQLRTYLDAACQNNPEMRQRIERLLGVAPEADDFFQRHAPPTANPPAPLDLSTTVVEGLTEDIGAVIGRYKLLQKIGEGGCGIVYMAEQQEPVRRRV